MRPKQVYLNDILIGTASTWKQVHDLLKSQRVEFLDTPGMAEGPTAFYVHGIAKSPGAAAARKSDNIA